MQPALGLGRGCRAGKADDAGVLQDSNYGTQIISKWKSLLENDQLLSHSSQDLSSDAFHRYQAPPHCVPLLLQGAGIVLKAG